GSPQLRLTRAQAAALEERLNRNVARFRTFIAMRYWHPSTEEALEAMSAEGIRRVVTLTLYPHYSRATTGSSERELQRTLQRPKWRGRFDVTGIASYPDDPLYLDAMADTVRQAYESFPPERRGNVVLLFSAHGLPKSFVDRGDPYVDHIQATRRGILERLGIPNRHELAYQSRTGPVEWIGPGTEEMIERLAKEGVRDLLLVPLSFVSDHIETLYEVDILFAEEAQKHGIELYRRPAALNTHPVFIDALAGLVERHLGRV
ncbi:MAG TPA: ferrochelatase, partial [Vicinamibacterales bacterium]|nr:ferrochelatase [Vicinamibacterales bacterium]